MKIVGIDWIHTVALSNTDGGPLQTRHTVRERERSRDMVFECGCVSASTAREWSAADEHGQPVLALVNYPEKLDTGDGVWRVTLDVRRPSFDITSPDSLQLLWDIVRRNLTPSSGVWTTIHAVYIDPRHTGAAVELYITETDERPSIIVTGHAIQLGRAPTAYEHTHDNQEDEPVAEPPPVLETDDGGATEDRAEHTDHRDVPDGDDGAGQPDVSEPPEFPGGAEADVPRSSDRQGGGVWDLPDYG